MHIAIEDRAADHPDRRGVLGGVQHVLGALGAQFADRKLNVECAEE